MPASILDGKRVSAVIRTSIQQTIEQLTAQGFRPPCLAVVLVGSDPASELYIRHKRNACTDLGIESIIHQVAYDTNEQALLDLLAALNHNPAVDGILVQLPLPTHVTTSNVLEHIDPNKDVDGFHPLNLGRLAQGHPTIRPCTPWGIMRLLQQYDLDVSGLNALVIGSSTIVGRPMALELLLAKATVTIAHRKTQNLAQHVRQADLIVSATGVPNLIQPDWLHSKQIIIDVGIHRDANHHITGDLNFAEAQSRVAWITPVPGGVGPMTVTVLMENTLGCWLRKQHHASTKTPP